MSIPSFFKDIEHFRVLLNKLGKEQNPFLFAVNYELDESFVWENPNEANSVLFAVGDMIHSETKDENALVEKRFEPSFISKNVYTDKFNIIHRGLKRGDSFLANLTVKTPLETDWSLEEIFYRSRAPYRICLPGRFVCFSPERFIRISNGEISSNPMKGTISSSVPDAEGKILSDFKETAEHCTIVDLIRNDLSQVADGVHVKRFRYIDRIATHWSEDLLQVSSEIAGKLPEDYAEHLGDILLSLLPAGSICGAPKKATVELISRAEGERRNFYTGVFGYFDGQNMDSAVMIRFIEEENGQKFFRSGGGITAYSQCEDEYNEVLEKIYVPFV